MEEQKDDIIENLEEEPPIQYTQSQMIRYVKNITMQTMANIQIIIFFRPFLNTVYAFRLNKHTTKFHLP